MFLFKMLIMLIINHHIISKLTSKQHTVETSEQEFVISYVCKKDTTNAELT